jgi:hypothetical protein
MRTTRETVPFTSMKYRRWRSSAVSLLVKPNNVSNIFIKIHLYPRLDQPNTGLLLAKKGGETDEHCEIFHFSGFGRCGARRFCLC